MVYLIAHIAEWFPKCQNKKLWKGIFHSPYCWVLSSLSEICTKKKLSKGIFHSPYCWAISKLSEISPMVWISVQRKLEIKLIAYIAHQFPDWNPWYACLQPMPPTMSPYVVHACQKSQNLLLMATSSAHSDSNWKKLHFFVKPALIFEDAWGQRCP